MATQVKTFSNSTPVGLASMLNTYFNDNPTITVMDIKYLESISEKALVSGEKVKVQTYIAFIQYNT